MWQVIHDILDTELDRMALYQPPHLNESSA